MPGVWNGAQSLGPVKPGNCREGPKSTCPWLAMPIVIRTRSEPALRSRLRTCRCLVLWLLPLAATAAWVRSYYVADYLWASVRGTELCVTGDRGQAWCFLEQVAGDASRFRFGHQCNEPSRCQTLRGMYWGARSYFDRGGFVIVAESRGPARLPWGAVVWKYGIVVPYWFVVTCLSLPLAWPRVRRWRERRRTARRRQKCLCPGCGYDLRASPGRCPECGTSDEEP